MTRGWDESEQMNRVLSFHRTITEGPFSQRAYLKLV